MLKTVKFGGSSLADAKQFEKVANIIRAEESRRYVVVSAPGKRNSADTKITDLLYRCYDQAKAGEDFSEALELIRTRYEEIVRDLGLSLDLSREFEAIARMLKRRPDRDYAASRGEYLSAVVMSAYLDRPMIDAADYIFFKKDGTFDAERTQRMLSMRLSQVPEAVLPGFYGSLPDGSVHTFSRGGSDVTGSIVARASGSDLYENWTDVSGLLTCDPRIVDNPRPIDSISYTELRELAYMGASVLHESAIFPVKKANIPINIRNTNAPQDAGTLILPDADCQTDRSITGIAGRKHFSLIRLEKEQMNETVGFAVNALQVLARYGVLVEHVPTGIDILSIVVSTQQLEEHREEVLEELKQVTQAETIAVNDEMALLAVVGRGMIKRHGVVGRIFNSLGEAGVNVEMIDQGSGELNVIIGVADADFETSVTALYQEFFGEE